MRSSTNGRPLVSIVLATYNGAYFLAEQLASLFQQTYTHFEVVAVDDRSTDETFAILQDFAVKHPAMRVYQNKEKLGFIKNFERACSLSQGTLIALCDQDDYWLPQKLERMVATIGDHALVYCNSALCNENLTPTGVSTGDRAHYGPVYNCLKLAVFNRIYGHAALITRSLLERSLPFLPCLPHDWWLCFTATFEGGIQYLPEELVYYRQHAANAVGAVGSKGRKSTLVATGNKDKKQKLTDIRNRVHAFYNYCPDGLVKEKDVLRRLAESYRSFSLKNNFSRMILFFQYKNTFLAAKKRNALRKFLFCIKMLWTIK